MKTLPATVIVALRLVPAVFDATVKPTEPAPEPEAPLITTNHDALLDAVHAQPVVELTLKFDEPPPLAKDAELGVKL